MFKNRKIPFLLICLFFVTFLMSCRLEGGNYPNPIPFQGTEDLYQVIERISDSRMVLLGEASHGTEEFYRWRKEITKKLIEEHGFDFIVVEGDWPAHWKINLHVKGIEPATDMEELFNVFERWPSWMWRNRTIVDLVEWLTEYNSFAEDMVGFYGMDVYGIELSYEAVVDKIRGEASLDDEIISLLGCFGEYVKDPQEYARSYARGEVDCSEALRQARMIVGNEARYNLEDRDSLNLERNMAVLFYGEKHYRAMVDPGLENWNVRVEFMNDTIERLLEFYGEESRGIVWAHNTHIGDARATTMARQGRFNIGQLMRQKLGMENVSLVGFGTGTGTVKAGRSWGGGGQVMEIPYPVEESYEYLFKDKEYDKFFYIFDENSRSPENWLMEPRGHRAIGVVYNPEREHLGNFVPTVLPLRYDIFMFFRKTKAISEWGK